MPAEGGVIFKGSKGNLMCGVYGDSPRLVPEALMKEAKFPEKTLPRNGGIFDEFVQACKGGAPTTSNFPDSAGPLTEMILLGILAMRAGPGKKLLWDGPNLKCTNVPAVNRYVKREYRKGWEV